MNWLPKDWTPQRIPTPSPIADCPACGGILHADTGKCLGLCDGRPRTVYVSETPERRLDPDSPEERLLRDIFGESR